MKTAGNCNGKLSGAEQWMHRMILVQNNGCAEDFDAEFLYDTE